MILVLITLRIFVKLNHFENIFFTINLFNNIIDCIIINDIFPLKWKEAILIPILKPNKPPKSVNSYCPIVF